MFYHLQSKDPRAHFSKFEVKRLFSIRQLRGVSLSAYKCKQLNVNNSSAMYILYFVSQQFVLGQLASSIQLVCMARVTVMLALFMLVELFSC